MVGLEFVADRGSRRAFPRAARLTEAIVRTSREHGLLVYPGTGNADGVDGDLILLGPPFVVTDAELVAIADRLTASVDAAIEAIAEAATSG
jgi:adenosylmethionine-8-amino-7-oxononanoate aminotransferase